MASALHQIICVVFVTYMLLFNTFVTVRAEEMTGEFISVKPFAETVPVDTQGDAADDPEIWVNPTDIQKSLVLGTDKKRGLMVFDLKGQLVDRFDIGKLNNIDLRAGFPFEGRDMVLVGASDRTRGGVTLFVIDPVIGKLRHLENSFFKVDVETPYGFCLYQRDADKKLFAIVTSKKGEVRQFELSPESSNKVGAKLVRSFDVGSIAEGCVVHDATGRLYIGEENVGIWRYDVAPDAGTERRMVLKLDEKQFKADVEGLTILPGADGANGYLIGSIQGSHTFAVLSLEDEMLLGAFRVVDNDEANVDAVSKTDGVSAAIGNFGPDAPNGLIVVQDDENVGDTQNFKYVSWDAILEKLN